MKTIVALPGQGDRRIRAQVVARVEELTRDPELAGKFLAGELAGYRTIRAAGQRCRIIYRVERGG